MRPIHPKRRRVEIESFAANFRKGIIHWENIGVLGPALKYFVKLTGTRKWGERKALDLQVMDLHLYFPNLPESFHNTTFLFMTDLHIDGMPAMIKKIKDLTAELDYEFCILGGDYRYHVKGNPNLAFDCITELVEHLRNKSRILGILGNHDEYAFATLLNHLGVEMLVNEFTMITKNKESIYMVGLDDCHYYGSDDLELAQKDIPRDAFKILICHSPELYQQASQNHYSLYLAGHTHGGQVCLPGGIPLIMNAKTPSRIARGYWRYKGMQGYTSYGVGASGAPVRFFCPPEIVLVVLKKGNPDQDDKLPKDTAG